MKFTHMRQDSYPPTRPLPTQPNRGIGHTSSTSPVCNKGHINTTLVQDPLLEELL